MHVIDHRYRAEQRQYEMAIRFVRHNARTRTICTWTGLSADRVRKLFRTYATEVAALAHSRLRGTTPYQTGFFTRTARIRTETAILAGYLHLNGAVAEEHSLSCAERLCESFETFVQVVPHTAITFEHAVLLLRALRRGESLQIRHCQRCEVLVAVDRIRRPSATCVGCT